MKFAGLLAVVLLSTNNAFAQTERNVFSTEKYKEQTLNYDELATPIILQMKEFGFEKTLNGQILAPQRGTDFAFSLNHSQLNTSREDSNGKGSGTADYSIGSLAIAHALNSQLFFGAKLGYGLYKSKYEYTSNSSHMSRPSESNSSDLIDPSVTVGGRINTGGISSIFALSASLKTEDQKSEYTSSEVKSESKSNLRNGGYAYIPSVTIFSNSKTSTTFGLSLAYSLMQERTQFSRNSDGSTSKWTYTKGNVQDISVFAEIPASNLSLGGSLKYTKHEASTSKVNGHEYEGIAMAYTSATAFAKINIAKNFAVIPSATIGRFGEGSEEMDTKDIYAVGITGKTAF